MQYWLGKAGGDVALSSSRMLQDSTWQLMCLTWLCPQLGSEEGGRGPWERQGRERGEGGGTSHGATSGHCYL